MLNGISSSATSPLDTLSPISENLETPPAGPGNEEQANGAGGSSNLEEEIEDTLKVLAQELQQLATELNGSQGLPQSQDDSSPDGAPGIASSGSSPQNAQPQSLAVADPGSNPSGSNAAAASSGANPLTSAEGPSGAAPGGALGPNVPTALQPFVQDINAASKQTGVPASLIGAQILQESGGNPNAVTTNPALGLPDTGLMQVDQATFQGLQKQYPDLLGGKSVSDPSTNIMAGALLDSQLLKQNNGNLGAALTAYNGSADPSYVNEVTAKMNALQNGTPVPGGFS